MRPYQVASLLLAISTELRSCCTLITFRGLPFCCMILAQNARSPCMQALFVAWSFVAQNARFQCMQALFVAWSLHKMHVLNACRRFSLRDPCTKCTFSMHAGAFRCVILCCTKCTFSMHAGAFRCVILLHKMHVFNACRLFLLHDPCTKCTFSMHAGSFRCMILCCTKCTCLMHAGATASCSRACLVRIFINLRTYQSTTWSCTKCTCQMHAGATASCSRACPVRCS